MFDPLLAQHRRLAGRGLAVLLSAGMVMVSGCGSLSKVSRREQVRQQVENDPRYSVAGIQGPVQRNLSQSSWERKKAELLRSGDEATIAALNQFDAAKQLFDDGEYAAAEKEFRKIVKQRRDLHEGFLAKVRRAWGVAEEKSNSIYATYGDAIEEDAMFMLAESQYAQRNYPDAEKTYQELLTKYPSTRYLDPVTRQLFRIARYWLDFPEEQGATGNDDVKLANHEQKELGKLEEPTKRPSVTSRVPVLPNLTDKSRPLFDTYGRGKNALRSIWLHDAAGPLADDALMLAANHALRTEDYVEAARLYALLREQYPDSKHLKDAYLLGSHVTLASYLGPAYDGKSLETSRQLKQEMLALFPDLTTEQRKQLEGEVERLQEAEVARLWDLVEFYRIKRMNPAVKLHCYLIINRHPDSKYADLAREELKRVAEKEEQWARSPFNFNKPKPPAPVAQAPQPKSEPQPKPEPEKPVRITLPESTPDSTEKGPTEPNAMPKPSKPPTLLQRMNPLRRSEQPPKLETIDPQKSPNSHDEKNEAPPQEDVPLRASFEKNKS